MKRSLSPRSRARFARLARSTKTNCGVSVWCQVTWSQRYEYTVVPRWQRRRVHARRCALSQMRSASVDALDGEAVSIRLSYQRDHAENPCGRCGAAPGVICEHDEVELLGVTPTRERGPVEPEPKIAKGDSL